MSQCDAQDELMQKADRKSEKPYADAQDELISVCLIVLDNMGTSYW